MSPLIIHGSDGASPSRDLASRLREAHAAAIEAARAAVRGCGEAVQKAAACGRVLLEARDALKEKGCFVSWIEANWPEGGIRTAYRWMKLAESPEELWQDAVSLRQAYIAVGLLPEPGPAEHSPDENKPQWNYLVHLARAERALQKQREELDRLSRKEKDVLKERLRPWVEMFNRL